MAGLLGPCKLVPQLCVGLEVNRDLLNPRADTDICAAVSTAVSAPDGCVRAGCPALPPARTGERLLKVLSTDLILPLLTSAGIFVLT